MQEQALALQALAPELGPVLEQEQAASPQVLVREREQVSVQVQERVADVLPEGPAAVAGQAEFQAGYHRQVRLPVDVLLVGPAAAAEIPA